MRVLLGTYGYQAVIASSVSDALKSARSGGIALCILDHWLTESNGIELCQQIRSFDSHTPIMFYSGAAYKTDIEKGLDAGAQAYLVKPDFDHLKPTIDHSSRRRRKNHPPRFQNSGSSVAPHNGLHL